MRQEGERVPRYLFVVSRRNPELFAYLQVRFADDARVDVILDRRQHQRRQRLNAAVDTDRRRGERRLRDDVEPELERVSHAIVTID